MTTNSDSGHAKNLSNFGEVVAYLSILGPKYCPPADRLALGALTLSLTKGRDALSSWYSAENHLRTKSAERSKLFDDVNPLLSRIGGFVDISPADIRTKDAVKGFIAKLRGNNKSKPKAAQVAVAEGDPAPRTNSTTQRSYVMVAENFSKLVTVIEDMAGYTVTDEALKVGALRTLSGKLSAANTDVTQAELALSDARAYRDMVLYDDADSLLNVMRDVKNFVKAAFGPNSSEYRNIRGFEFKSL